MPGHRHRRGKRVIHQPIGDPADPCGLFNLMQAHVSWLQTAGYAASTVDSKEGHIRRFVIWADERAIRRADEVTRPILERYQRYLFHLRKPNGDPLSFGAQKGRLIPVCGFFKWLARYHHIDTNPAAELQLPKVENRIPKAVFSVSEIEQILMQPDLGDPLQLRDRAILEVLYATGVRRTECAYLKVFDVDHDRMTLLVREGKGKKDRLVPISERALRWIEKYKHEVRPELIVGHDEGWLFLTDDGHRIGPEHLGSRVSRYVKKAELGKGGSCHLFRHSMATLMLEHGADIRMIQAMLGHNDISSTQIYTRVAIKQLQRVYLDTHPGADTTRPDLDSD